MLSAAQDRKRVKNRKWCLLAAGSLVFLALAGQLFSLQVAGWQYYRVQSEANRIRAVLIPAARGLILDRNGEIFVDNKASYTVSIIPGGLKRDHINALIGRLGGLMNLDRSIVDRRLNRRRGSYQPVKLKRNVDIRAVSWLEENCLEFPGIVYETEIRRKYPFGQLACHILGHVGEISEPEFGQLEGDGYLAGDLVGKEGIERACEAALRGKRGIEYIETNAAGREIRGFPERAIEPTPGANVVLTIDRHLQQVAESAFPDTMAGSLVALDPRNGEILVLMSRPGFAPSVFSGVLKQADWDKLDHDPTHPLLNRAIQSAYPPGSTFKMLSALAGLDAGVIHVDTVLDSCGGSLCFGDREFSCWSAHGRLNVFDAIVQSCDVFFYHLAQRLSLDALNAQAQLFGLGLATGVDLGYETKGVVPSSAYYDQRYGKNGWTKGLMLNLCIGQGELLVSPIQMARYVGAIATGRLCAPHLVRCVEGRESARPGYPYEEISVPSQDLELIRSAMVGVLEDRKGTAHSCRIPGIQFGGKTGTAQNPHGEDHAWFVAFAPAVSPTIAVAAIVENGGHGGSAAAPVVCEVIRAHLPRTVASAKGAGRERG